MMVSALALPTEARHFGDINGLVPSLGKYGPIDRQRVSGGHPKPAGPPQKRTAALADQGGGSEDRKAGAQSKAENYYTNRLTASAPRIVAPALRALALPAPTDRTAAERQRRHRDAPGLFEVHPPD